MRSLVLVAPSKFEITQFDRPTPGEDEVLIRVAACGICGSDVHGMDGSSGRRIPPIVMGHEAAGEIVSVGSGVTRFDVGDRVTFDSTIYCGKCPHCLRGEINLCDNRMVLGVSCGDYRRHGAFAEFVAVPERVLYRLPDALSYDRAAMVEPVSIALHGVHRVAPTADSVAVIGAGMIGTLVVQALRAHGWKRIVAVDIDDNKLEFARNVGAHETYKPDQAPLASVDAAIEAVGATATVSLAIEMTRKGGRVALVGNLSPRVEIPLQSVVTREIDLRGCCSSRGEYAEALELMASGAIEVDSMISARSSLEDAPSWFYRLHDREPGLMKVIVNP